MKRYQLFVLTAFAALSACGGGSSSTSDPTVVVPKEALAGRAVKGVVQFADVQAYQHIGGIWSLSASTSTDARGAFSFPSGVPEGVVRLVVRPAVNGSSRIICDAASGCGAVGVDASGDLNENNVIDFGESMPMPLDFTLAAIVPAERDESFVAAVTPMTHLAAALLESLPRTIDDRAIDISLHQVAQLFSLDDDFEAKAPIDITDAAEMSAASAADVQHGLMSAAFSEMAGSNSVQQILNRYAQRFSMLAGQLPVFGVGSVDELSAAAMTVAGGAGANDDNVSRLNTWRAKWSGNLTNVVLAGDYDAADLETALTSLDELDYYLPMAGIDESGTFITAQGQQVSWLLNEDMLSLATVMLDSVSLVVNASIVASINGSAEPTVSISAPDGLVATFTRATNRLVISGERLGQTLNAEFAITPLLSGLEQGLLTYSVPGTATLSNATQSGELSGALTIDFNQSNMSMLLAALTGSGELTQEQALEQFLATMHVTASIDGSASLAKTENEDYAFDGEIDAYADINVPALLSESPFITLSIRSGILVGPEGDAIYSTGSGDALTITIDDTATLDANFGFEAFGWPEMEISASGTMSGLGLLATTLANDVVSSGAFEASVLMESILNIDLSILDLQGTGTLNIPADGKLWMFTLEGNRFDASQPNSDQLALSYYLTSFAGGYIYSGDSLLATVTFDWWKLGATIYLINGESRQYFLGDILAVLPD